MKISTIAVKISEIGSNFSLIQNKPSVKIAKHLIFFVPKWPKYFEVDGDLQVLMHKQRKIAKSIPFK